RNGHAGAQKVNNTLFKHSLKRLDSSCKNILPPDIKNGKFVKYKKNIKMQNKKTKSQILPDSGI
ncbi:hypothetical protein NQ314_015323, partial [Rhamnusium bicolor]